MSNLTVTDVAQALLANTADIYSELKTTAVKATEDSDFSKIMVSASGEASGNQSNVADRIPEKSATAIDKTAAKEIKSVDKSLDNKKDISDAKDCADVAKDAATKVLKITDVIKKEFNITDEELESAMESLGLTMQDMLNPAKLNELMMEIGGVEDSISLITNSDLYMSIKAVSEVLQTELTNVTVDNGITVDELNEVLGSEAFDSAMGELEEFVESNPELELDDVINKFLNETNVEDISDEQQYDATKVIVSVETNEVKPADTQNMAIQNAVQSTTDEADLGESETFKQVQDVQQDPMKGRHESYDNISRLVKDERTDRISDNSSSNVGFNENVVSRTEINNVGDVVETVTRYVNADSNDIVSQVTESIRVNYTPDATTLEMQLHPASLGTVNMQIASENGVVTAHILVQDAAVKAALETQLISLQETFNEQGQKVEAIEVSIASYDLNKGMNQNERDDSADSQKNNFKVGNRRRINLNDLEEDIEGEEEIVTEEERIARDMMERNGNTVDYTV